MDSKKQVELAVRGLFDCLEQHEEDLPWKKYEIIRRDEQGRYTKTLTVAIPQTQSWFESPPEEYANVEEAIDGIVEDEEVQLLQSRTAVANALDNAVREATIELNRKNLNEVLIEDLTLHDRLYSQGKTAVSVSPIVGLSFDEEVRLTESFRIRGATDLEKELVLNSRDIGGGSITTRRAIQHDSLTHLASFEYCQETGEEWKQGIELFSGIGRESQEHQKALRSALQMVQSSKFQMGVSHTIDKTFYPEVMSSMEYRRAHSQGVFVNTENLTSTDRLKEYFELVLHANKQDDEGLRVAIDRLESSYRKVSNADAVVDAIIGVEALLSTDPSERFRAVRRRAAVMSGNKSTYSQLGRLQKIRNSTVHGSETQVNQEDIDQARTVLSSVLSQVISMTAEGNQTREELIDTLDSTIEELIHHHFQEAVSEFE